MLMVKAKADRVCCDLDLDLNELHCLSKSMKNVEPEEEGELHISEGADVVMGPLKERILPDPPLMKPRFSRRVISKCGSLSESHLLM